VLPALPERVIFEEVVVTPRKAFLPLPDLRLVERPGWVQIVTPSLKQGGLNEVAFAALGELEADAVIDVAIAEYRALGVKFRWTVGPDSAPPDLADRLARRGLERGQTRGMARSTEGFAAGGAGGPVRVDEVDASTLDDFTRVMAEGWDIDPGPLARVNEAALASEGHRLFVARLDGEPAAVAGYVAFARSAFLLGGVVLPRFRGRGLYRALVGARLEDARARGIALATSHAREETSAPLLEKMGFETVCHFSTFHG
jgi:GNAT superfamily N-acetyltransferase